jgi:putative transposase
LSIQRACRAVNLSRAAYCRAAKEIAAGDDLVIQALNGSSPNTAAGVFGSVTNACGSTVISEIISVPGGSTAPCALNLLRRARKRLMRPPQPLDAPLLPNEIWALDFMSDNLYQGRRFRTLNILDEGVRKALAIEIDTSLPAERVVRTLQQLITWRGCPKALRLDNGPELTAQRFTTWCAVMGIELRHIQPAPRLYLSPHT